MTTAVNGFKCTGIFPPDRSVWADCDFASSDKIESDNPPNSTSETESNTTLETQQDTSPNEKAEAGPSCSDVTTVSSLDRSLSHTTTQESETRFQVVNTIGDGRCFFRSIVIVEDKSLQNIERCPNGLATNLKIRIKELNASDKLRSQMIDHMLENFEMYKDFSSDVVNADLPIHKSSFDSIEDRITEMSNPTEMVGEIEIIAVTRILAKQIDIHTGDGVVHHYGPEFAENGIVSMKYNGSGSDAGHYEALVKLSSDETNTEKSLIGPDVVSPIPKINSKPSKRKTMKSEVITSSPYKKNLLEKKPKAKCKKIEINNKRVGNKMENQNSQVDSDDDSDKDTWYCPLCEEERREAMVRCILCCAWIHQSCAGGIPPRYKCDLCD